jgi:prepilin-type processing-associated H-X9-DG protein
MEQDALFKLLPTIFNASSTFLSMATAPFINHDALFANANVVIAYNQKVDALICPSNDGLFDDPVAGLTIGFVWSTDAPQWIVFRSTGTSPTAFGRTSYIPSAGGFSKATVSATRGIDISLQDAQGPFRNRNLSISVEKLGDGSANTIMWGECLGNINPNVPNGPPTLDRANFALFHTGLITGHRWLYPNPLGSLPALQFGSSQRSLDFLVGSRHSAGSNISRCDGSVEFLSAGTDRGVMAALGCGNDGWVKGR